ncbi:hypothetical protein HUE87_00040 [Candidatus Sulfurimonas marisnigri]|uniref:Uncharacterized protein n=1 Tax=Candidatus Sulfurimonas marisnigri TaxID=2740405 RepID=A0A7S7M0A0_9BACT|nr:hypothetical protein [Candidatus Sulfurimonas marisnigri]QOY54676.1 hypothetical protein HUE87_00040 [Candidatus Sulfurimonas marisnigri]
MDDLIYPASLFAIAITAFSFYQSGNTKFAFFILAIGVYIIYSHETGNTATDFKNDMVISIDNKAADFSKSSGTGKYDASEAVKFLDKEKK